MSPPCGWQVASASLVHPLAPALRVQTSNLSWFTFASSRCPPVEFADCPSRLLALHPPLLGRGSPLEEKCYQRPFTMGDWLCADSSLALPQAPCSSPLALGSPQAKRQPLFFCPLRILVGVNQVRPLFVPCCSFARAPCWGLGVPSPAASALLHRHGTISTSPPGPPPIRPTGRPRGNAAPGRAAFVHHRSGPALFIPFLLSSIFSFPLSPFLYGPPAGHPSCPVPLGWPAA